MTIIKMNSDRSSTLSSSMSVTISRQGGGNNTNQICSSQSKTSKSPINQFYCNICFCPLMTFQNINRASFVTSCGHFYCEQCAQSSKTNEIFSNWNIFSLLISFSRRHANM
jgi:hypothetical protein